MLCVCASPVRLGPVRHEGKKAHAITAGLLCGPGEGSVGLAGFLVGGDPAVGSHRSEVVTRS